MRLLIAIMLCLCVMPGLGFCQDAGDAVPPPTPVTAETVSPDPPSQPTQVTAPEVAKPAPSAAVVTPEKKVVPASKPAADNRVGATKQATSEKPKTSAADSVEAGTSVKVEEVKPILPPTAKRQDKVAMLGEQKDKPAPAGRVVAGWSKTLLVTLLKLAFVLGLAYLTILALKWLSAKRETVPRGTCDIRIVETLGLPTGGYLHLVSIQGRTLLIGSAAGQVSLLTEMEAGEAPEEIADAGSRFAEHLEKYYVSGKPAGPAARIAALLRDCSQHLQSRRQGIARSGRAGAGDSNES
jgi:flagellar biogenesis protein FliO